MKKIYTHKLLAQTLNELDSIKNIAGYELKETFSFSNYTIFLSKILMNIGPNLPKYQIGLVRNDQKTFTPQDQFENKDIKIPAEDPLEIINQMGIKIKQWQNKYGKILALSMNPKKNKNYETILNAIGIPFTKVNIQHLQGMII